MTKIGVLEIGRLCFSRALNPERAVCKVINIDSNAACIQVLQSKTNSTNEPYINSLHAESTNSMQELQRVVFAVDLAQNDNTVILDDRAEVIGQIQASYHDLFSCEMLKDD